MAFNLTYTVTSGVVPVTVELLSSGKAPNIHVSIPSQDSFTNVADGTYTLRFTDNQGCIEETQVGYINECAENGLLYNFMTIENPSNIAPSGYRVAKLEDILNLINYLGGDIVAGGKLKALEQWNAPNTGATNESGFNATPAGWRDELGEFVMKLMGNRIWINNQ